MAKTINNKTLIYFYIVFLICVCHTCYADSNNIGKIDLNKALILHPKMAFFDYERLGFYKEHLDDGKNQLSSTNIQIDKSEEIQSIKNKIRELKFKLNDIPPVTNGKSNEEEIKSLIAQIDSLTNKLTDIEFDITNNDITNVSETKEILSLISKEISNSIEEVAAEQNLSVVLNDSNLVANSFPDLYENRIVYKKNNSTVNIGDNPYYLFLSESINSKKTGELPSSINLSNWLEYARNPNVVRSLPLRNQHLVISGSKDILLEVLKKVYLKNNCSLDKYQKIESVLMSLNN